MPVPVGIAIAATCAVGLLYYLARWALYHPSKYTDGYRDAQKLVGAADAWIEASDGVKIHGWWVQRRQDGISTPDVVPRKTPDGTQPDGGREGSPLVTLFLHGNGDNIAFYKPHLEAISAAGSSVLTIDYRGYGKSGGRPSEQGLYRDSEAGYIYLLGKGYRAEQIILHGQSLGTAVAVDLASRRPCSALILEAPFTSASNVAGTLVPFIGPLLVRSYNSLPKILSVRAPKLFIHGDRDEVIPLRLGQELFAAAQGTKTFWIVPGAGHNDILETAGAEYRHRLRAFYETLLHSH